MINRLSNFFFRKKVSRLLRKITEIIYSGNFEFDKVLAFFPNPKDKTDTLLYFIIIEISSLRVPSSLDERIDEILQIYYRQLQAIIRDERFQDTLKLQELKAKLQLKKIEGEFYLASELIKINDHSFEVMRYQMETAKKGPLTQEEWKNILDIHKKNK